MKYGKLNNGVIEYAPYHLVKHGIDILGYNYDGNSVMLLADGYKPVEVLTYPTDGKEYLKSITETADKIIDGWQEKPAPTDKEIVAKREQLYAGISDRAFASYNQGGGTSLKSAILQKAQIQFENKKSYQKDMTMRDFVAKVTKEYDDADARASGSGSLEVGFIENPSGGRKDVESITFGRGLTGFSDPNANGVIVEASDKGKKAPCYYASLTANEEVLPKKGSDISFSPIFFDNTIVANRLDVLNVDRNKKAIGIQEYDGKDPNKTGGTDYFMIGRFAMLGDALSKGYVKVKFIYADNKEVVKDIDGNDLEFVKSYTEGKTLGVIHTFGVVPAKGIRYIVPIIEHNFTKPITLGDYTSGNSCVVFQALKGDEVGEALMKYEQDTGDRILLNKRYIGDLFDNSFSASFDRALTIGDKGQWLGQIPDVHLNNTTKLGVEIKDGKVILSSDKKDVAYFSYGTVFKAELTEVLREQQIDVDVDVENPNSGVDVQLVKWTGLADSYDKNIILDYDADTGAVFETEWELVGKGFIAENNQAVKTFSFTVPADAKNIAVLITPVEAQNPLNITINKLNVHAANPHYSFITRGFEKLSEKRLHEVKNEAVFTSPLPYGYENYRFSSNTINEPLPTGILKSGNIPATLTKWVTIKGLDYGNENDLTYKKDEQVEVDCKFNLHDPKLEGITAYLAKYANGVYTEIQNSEVKYVPLLADELEAEIPTISAQVNKGDVVCLGFRSPNGNAYLETSDKRYPMMTVNVRTKG